MELEAAKAAEEQLAVLQEAWLADVVDLDHVAAAVVVAPISIPAKYREMLAVVQHHHLERGP